jgi:endonuclease/exonuclease/phosphatase family metal-dependent hydrolase
LSEDQPSQPLRGSGMFGPFLNFATCWTNTRVDYIWLSEKFPGTVRTYSTVDSNASDHYPVVVDIEMHI